jgi:DNA-binding Xre family transcriptional regulator
MAYNPTRISRPQGRRYELSEPDGSWWELGWDRPLGTFYAQHYNADNHRSNPDAPDIWHGARPFEITTVADLATLLSVPVPADIADELASDAAAFPCDRMPPFLHLVEDIAERIHLDQGSRHTLPAAPVAEALERLRSDPYLADEELSTFAKGLGLDPALTGDIVTGRVQQLQVRQIAHLCEALRCSPYDLWGPQLGRQILEVYGPEHWPEYIEPLSDGRTPSLADGFIARRVEQQAAEVVQVEATRTTVEVTPYRQVAILAVHQDGAIERVADAHGAAEATVEYHFAFQRAGDPHKVALPVAPSEFLAGAAPGHDAPPALVDVAHSLEREVPATDMLRFRGPDGAERWLGRETPFDTWQSWDDPRLDFPGEPLIVLSDELVERDITFSLDHHGGECPNLPLSIEAGIDL